MWPALDACVGLSSVPHAAPARRICLPKGPGLQRDPGPTCESSPTGHPARSRGSTSLVPTNGGMALLSNHIVKSHVSDSMPVSGADEIAPAHDGSPVPGAPRWPYSQELTGRPKS